MSGTPSEGVGRQHERLGYSFTPVPNWLLKEWEEGRLSDEARVLHEAIYRAAPTRVLMVRGEFSILRTTLAQRCRRPDDESFTRLLRRERERGHLNYRVQGHASTAFSYVITPYPDGPVRPVSDKQRPRILRAEPTSAVGASRTVGDLSDRAIQLSDHEEGGMVHVEPLAQRDNGDRVVALAQNLDAFVKQVYFPWLDGLVVSGRRSERGVDLYRERWHLHVSPRLGQQKIGDVEAHHLAALIHSMRRNGYAESTIASVLLILRAVYRLAIRRGLVSRSPLDGLDPAELPRPRVGGHGRVLDERELAALVRHADPRYKAVVTTLAYSGLRLSEALGLRWCDLDFVDAEITVSGQLSMARKDRPVRVLPTKTSAGVRIVPMLPAVEEALVALLHQEQVAGRGSDSDFVFVSRAGTPLHQRNVAVRGVESAARRAGLGKVTPHDLRRSFCSLSGRRGVDPVEAAQMTGHSLSVWMKSYARSFGKPQRDEARERLLSFGLGESQVPDARPPKRSFEAVPTLPADIPLTSDG